MRPVGPHQQVAQRDHRAGLARAGRHDQQRLALPVAFERLADATDGALLIEPLDDGGIDRVVGQSFSAGVNTLLLPVGATEQHGPHLPCDTDTVIAEAVCAWPAR